MAKIDRSTLKEIVREVLVELLHEGLGATGPSLNESRKPATVVPKRPVVPDVIQSRRKIPVSVPAPAPVTPAISQRVASLAVNDVMREIFSDTEQTTLREQLDADRSMPSRSTPGPMPGDAMRAKMKDADFDTQVVEEDSHWAKLAFMSAKK